MLALHSTAWPLRFELLLEPALASLCMWQPAAVNHKIISLNSNCHIGELPCTSYICDLQMIKSGWKMAPMAECGYWETILGRQGQSR